MVRTLWAILPPARRVRVVLVILGAAIAAAGEAAVVLLVAPVVSGIVGGDAADHASGGSTRPLVLFALALVAKNVVVLVLSWFKNRELFAIQAEVSERLLEIYIRGTNGRVRQLDAGQRTSFAITEPLQLVLNGYQPLVNGFAEALTLLAVTIVLVFERPVETAALGVSLGVGLGLFTALTRARIVASGFRRKESDTRRAELVRAVLESRAEVRGLGVAAEVVGRYRTANVESAAMTARKAFLTEASRNVVELLVVGAVGMLALVFVYAEGAELLAVLAMFGVAAYRAMPAINRLMVSSQSAKFGVATAETIHGILAAEAEVTAAPARTSRDDGRGDGHVLELAFDGFRLANGKAVLDGRTIRLGPGQVCVIHGPSGSGKSTLVEALIDGGEGVSVVVDGERLPNGLSDLGGRVGVTGQSPLVLPASLWENLSLGRRDDSVDLAAAAPLLDTDASSILDGASIATRLDTPIHRHAVSGGQAQRISLIRALADDNEIVVLDEPTSALDRSAARALRDRIAGDGTGRIYVIVTHDRELEQIADVLVEVG